MSTKCQPLTITEQVKEPPSEVSKTMGTSRVILEDLHSVSGIVTPKPLDSQKFEVVSPRLG